MGVIRGVGRPSPQPARVPATPLPSVPLSESTPVVGARVHPGPGGQGSSPMFTPVRMGTKPPSPELGYASAAGQSALEPALQASRGDRGRAAPRSSSPQPHGRDPGQADGPARGRGDGG